MIPRVEALLHCSPQALNGSFEASSSCPSNTAPGRPPVPTSGCFVAAKRKVRRARHRAALEKPEGRVWVGSDPSNRGRAVIGPAAPAADRRRSHAPARLAGQLHDDSCEYQSSEWTGGSPSKRWLAAIGNCRHSSANAEQPQPV